MITINDNNEIEIFNIVPVYRGSRIIKYITSASITDINLVSDRLQYDEKTQRGYVDRKAKKGKIESTRIYNTLNLLEMKEKILEDFFDGGLLTWNVRVQNAEDAKAVCEFVPEENKIIIKGNITLPDSSQRHMVIAGLKDFNLRINPSSYCFPLAISLYTLAEEQNLFSEINGEGQRASKTRALFLNNSIKSALLKEIIHETAFKDNVETVTGVTHNKDKVVSFAVLYNSLFQRNAGAYRTLNEDEVKEFKSWIIKFYNELISVLPQLDKHTKEERDTIHKSTVLESVPLFYAYAYVAKNLEHEVHWKRKLIKLATTTYKAGMWEGEFLSLENPIWHNTIAFQNKAHNWKIVNNNRTQKFAIDIVLKHLNIVNI